MYEQNNLDRIPPSIENALLSLNRQSRNSTNIPGSTSIPGSTIPGISPQNADQFLSNNPVPAPAPASSVINLSNSNDVVIGPMTQYQGPVTIYQYMDATVEARATHAHGGIQQNRTNSTTLSQKLEDFGKIKILLIVLVLVVIAVGTFLYLDQNRGVQDRRKPEILFGNNYETGTLPNLGNGHLVVDRIQWGAQEIADDVYITLENPIPYVLITHVGVQSERCFNIYKCSIKMRSWQDSAIAERKLRDITSNFFIGDDGYVYVGRGWHKANCYAEKTLAITFMGDYIRHEPSEKQLEAVQYLIAYGLTNKHIALDYKLVAHNQTKATKSPGPNVYKHIVKWPHWYGCSKGDDDNWCGKEIGLPQEWDEKHDKINTIN